MRVTLTQIGNSTGLIIPKKILDRLKVKKGDDLFLTETPDGIAITNYNEEVEEQMKALEKGMSKYRNTLRKLAD